MMTLAKLHSRIMKLRCLLHEVEDLDRFAKEIDRYDEEIRVREEAKRKMIDRVTTTTRNYRNYKIELEKCNFIIKHAKKRKDISLAVWANKYEQLRRGDLSGIDGCDDVSKDN